MAAVIILNEQGTTKQPPLYHMYQNDPAILSALLIVTAIAALYSQFLL